MSPISINISVQDRGARAFIVGLVAAAHGEEVKQVAGRAAANAVKEHLRVQERARPNKLGGQRQHFYAGAARATFFKTVADGAMVHIAQTGFALRLYGGTVRAVNRRALTIPMRPEAYGMGAREIPGLFVIQSRGTRRAYLAQRQGKALRLFYRLVQSATIKPDRSILPKDAELAEAAVRAVDSLLARHMQRAGERMVR